MLHPLTLARLEDALARPGCPVCWEMERTTCHYLERLLREHKGSEQVWKRLRQSWGLCLPHTSRMLAAEARTIPGFNTATLYRWLAEAVLREAGRVGPGKTATRRLRTLLKPRAGCLSERFLAGLEVLATELEAFLDAHTPGRADRAKPDSDVWLRAAERFAGKLGPGD